MTYEELLAELRVYIATIEWESDRYGDDLWLDRVDKTLADLRADLAHQEGYDVSDV